VLGGGGPSSRPHGLVPWGGSLHGGPPRRQVGGSREFGWVEGGWAPCPQGHHRPSMSALSHLKKGGTGYAPRTRLPRNFPARPGKRDLGPGTVPHKNYTVILFYFICRSSSDPLFPPHLGVTCAFRVGHTNVCLKKSFQGEENSKVGGMGKWRQKHKHRATPPGGKKDHAMQKTEGSPPPPNLQQRTGRLPLLRQYLGQNICAPVVSSVSF